MKKRSNAMYGISRVDDEVYRAHAWRVSLRRRGKMHVKNFPDKTWGGKRRALSAAKSHRDSVLQSHPPLTRKEFSGAKRAHNNSGITGVYTYAKKYRLADSREMETWYWEAHWPTRPGESQTARFSVKTYGEERARQLAIEAREAGMRKLEGVFWASEPSIEITESRRVEDAESTEALELAMGEDLARNIRPAHNAGHNAKVNPFLWFPFSVMSTLASAAGDS